ncbi:hypothetical protein C8J57DRAFT_1448037 [Mycena rebaudengoi]|nr:hypothetical protein C8J57DRAFT_1448037 [Mycena rebaudengoi]
MPRDRYEAPPSSDEEDDEPRERRSNLVAMTVGTSLAGPTTRKSEFVSVLTSPQKVPRQRVPTGLREEAEGWDHAEPEDEVDPMMVHLLDEDGEDEVPPESEEEEAAKVPRKQRPSDNPLQQWLDDDRDIFLDEIMRLEGRGAYSAQTACAGGCGSRRHICRCVDCVGDELYCEHCIVHKHQAMPLHRIERWGNDGYFEKVSLKTLGLVVQLGHTFGERCPAPKQAPGNKFLVIHTNGLHEVAVDFCGCGQRSLHTTQLLRARWYPATGTNPVTAATFAVLDHYHLLSFESKCSCYEFYSALARETNNDGLMPSRDRYEDFKRMTREYFNLETLKRAARGHHPDRSANIKEGSCALLCPACPHPDKNLPPGWEDVPEDRKFLYALFLAIDANFRMKRKDVSSEEKDPGLGDGWSFYGEVKKYMAHLEKNWDQKQERSTCVAHDAVDKPDRDARGTASSGIGTVDCARHNLKRPRAVGDLQQGEKYLNMDYMFFMGLENSSELQRLFVSYDIACQWHKNIWERMKIYDSSVQLRGGKLFVTFLVPKWHLAAHIEECNILFSFYLTRFVGMTDGEAPERGWANANPLASSTREMGPGFRRDVINDHFNDWNHKKIVALGKTMLKKVEGAIPEMVRTQGDLADMEETLPPDVVKVWEEGVVRWENDAREPNPFRKTKTYKDVSQVRLEMAKEAALDVAGVEVQEEMHCTEMIAMGLQLEEQQRELGWDLSRVGLHQTAKQELSLVDRAAKLRRKIGAWMDIQVKFLPHVGVLRGEEEATRVRRARTHAEATTPGVAAHELQLWLPSAIKKRVACDVEIYRYEFRLREGQAHEALAKLRHELLVRSHLYKNKDRHARGVKANTRAITGIEAASERIRRAAETYRVGRKALLALGEVLEEPEWKKELKELKETDVREMKDGLIGNADRQQGKKDRQTKARAKERSKNDKVPLSWIWRTHGAVEDGGEDPALNEALHIEWAKTRARAWRWSEEVDLLEEEMRRIAQFLAWTGSWWERQKGRREDLEGALGEGLEAYASRQAARQRGLRSRFLQMWAGLPALIEKGRGAVAAELAEAATDAAAVAAGKELVDWVDT